MKTRQIAGLLVATTLTCMTFVSSATEPSVASGDNSGDNIVTLDSFVHQFATQEGKDILVKSPMERNLFLSSVNTPNRITREEFYLGLMLAGYYPLESGSLISIINLEDVKTAPLPTHTAATLDEVADYQIINFYLPLGGIGGMELVPILRPIVPRWGHLAGINKSSNALLVTCTAAGARKIMETISGLTPVRKEQQNSVE